MDGLHGNGHGCRRHVLDRLRSYAVRPWGHGEARAIQNQFTEVRNGNPLHGIAFEDATQDVDHLVGQGQDGLEKGRILQVGTERGILDRGTFPWVAAAGQVDQDDTQTPDVIRG